jgi:hypothetical protein
MKRAAIVWGAFVLAAAAGARAECELPKYHALDFWIGSWDVLSDGQVVASSTIERSSEGCAIVERYRQSDGYSGTSLSFHDPLLHRWRQSWVDTNGGVGEFVGEPGDDRMAFTGETHRPDGTKVLRKMTLTKQPDGAVRQQSLASTDGGKTWKPHYDFFYRKAAGR